MTDWRFPTGSSHLSASQITDIFGDRGRIRWRGGVTSREEVVWWSDTGATLHTDPNCPPFVRARFRAIQALAAGNLIVGTGIRSYDFCEDSGKQGRYPPDRLRLCRLCGASTS